MSGGGDSDLDALYQSVILEHARCPRNRRPLPGADRRGQGDNPLCGDQVAVALRLDGGVVAEAAFEGNGCAVCLASASLMTERVTGRPIIEARAWFDRLRALCAGAPPDPALGELAALGGVARFPSRIRCATLPWRALCAALDGDDAVVTTEE